MSTRTVCIIGTVMFALSLGAIWVYNLCDTNYYCGGDINNPIKVQREKEEPVQSNTATPEKGLRSWNAYKDPDSRWITNLDLREFYKLRQSMAHSGETCFTGMPKKTGDYTSKQLWDMGLVGVYTKDPESPSTKL